MTEHCPQPPIIRWVRDPERPEDEYLYDERFEMMRPTGDQGGWAPPPTSLSEAWKKDHRYDLTPAMRLARLRVVTRYAAEEVAQRGEFIPAHYQAGMMSAMLDAMDAADH